MPYIPAPNICRAELLFTWDGQSCETVLDFEPVASLTPALMLELGADLVGWWSSDIRPNVPTTLSLQRIQLTDQSSDISPSIAYATGLPLVGSNVGPSLPNNVAMVITKRTALRGRSYRGRIYHPGLLEGIVVNNTIDSGFANNVRNAYANLLSFATTGTTWDMVVVSRQNNNAPRVTADSNQVISLDVNLQVDSQRRRLPGRGR